MWGSKCSSYFMLWFMICYFYKNCRPVDMGPQWISKLSTRNNQDNQREYEERAVRHMAALLTRRTSGVPAGSQQRSNHHHHHHHHHGHHHHYHSHSHHHSMWNGHYTPPGNVLLGFEVPSHRPSCSSIILKFKCSVGGTYVRIEAEWREQHAGYSGSNNRIRPATSSHSLIRQKSKSGRWKFDVISSCGNIFMRNQVPCPTNIWRNFHQ